MSNFDFTLVRLDQLITHHIGNKSNEEGVLLSEQTTAIGENTLDYLLRYFLHPFKTEEIFSFTHDTDVTMNPVYALVKEIFEDQEKLVEHSKTLANLLYEKSDHPKIKNGELNVAYFSELGLNDEIVEAVGIFKSETDEPFLKMENEDANFHIGHEMGFSLKGLDKGCIVFNIEGEAGYHVLVVDITNKNNEAHYWKNAFLQLAPISNAYYQTKSFLDLTKDYLTEQVADEFEMNKTEQINLLNRSVEYFKNNETFDKEEFEQAVFEKEEMVESFRNFDSAYREERALAPTASFNISERAVKSQQKNFKSTIKLDKNFHIYIHGDQEMIEQGVDEDGRKYYKLYYYEEALRGEERGARGELLGGMQAPFGRLRERRLTDSKLKSIQI